MNTRDRLDRKLRDQIFSGGMPREEMFDYYRRVAENYALMENDIAVLSDLRSNVSHIYYGGFANKLGIKKHGANETITSIWEEELFRLIHPDDLERKHLEELCYHHYVSRQPKHRRGDYYMLSYLRMRMPTNSYMPVKHRMFYILTPGDETIWMALCLYSPVVQESIRGAVVVDSTDGSASELQVNDRHTILSAREKQILGYIDKGYTSKDIAELLSISKNTVSRHRQEILAKLQVKNSIEACRVAKSLKIILSRPSE